MSPRNVWSVKRLPISTQSAAFNDDIKNLLYLADIHVPSIETTNAMLLIGTDFPGAHIPLEVQSGNCDQPYARCTRLGWEIHGPLKTPCISKAINVNFQKTSDILLQQQLERMWTTDFDDRNKDDSKSMSVEDKCAMKTMETSVTFENGHYQLGLPWRDESTCLPNIWL